MKITNEWKKHFKILHQFANKTFPDQCWTCVVHFWEDGDYMIKYKSGVNFDLRISFIYQKSHNKYIYRKEIVDCSEIFSIKEEREGAWQALSDKEKLNISEVFIQNTFGLRAVRKYNFEEKLKIGKAHFLTRVNG